MTTASTAHSIDRSGNPEDRHSHNWQRYQPVLWVVVVLLIVGQAAASMMVGAMVASGGATAGMMWGYGPQAATGGSWMGGLVMALTMLSRTAFGVLALFGLVLLAGYLMRKVSVPTASLNEPPLTILQRRYAAGELTAEEYQRIRQELSQ